jgi:hypothetical protein
MRTFLGSTYAQCTATADLREMPLLLHDCDAWGFAVKEKIISWNLERETEEYHYLCRGSKFDRIHFWKGPLMDNQGL